MWNAVLCRYGELALKGGNRKRFEKHLHQGMKRLLRDVDDVRVWRERGRVVVHRPEFAPWSEDQMALILQQLGKVTGLVSFSPAVRVATTIEAIEEMALKVFPEAYAATIEGMHKGAPVPFAVHVRRAWKHFPMESTDFARRLADGIIPNYPRLSVDLLNPVLRLSAEVRDEWSYVYCQRFAGLGGMPAGTAEPVLSLLSGGIDSPVASYLAMKRGCSVDYLTFHSYPYTPMDAVDKVAKLARILNEYQRPGRLYACNLSEAQKVIRDHATESYRTVLYRRLMMRVAGAICTYHRHRAIVTGESIGQVASQTIPNLVAIDDAAPVMVLRPTICMDKDEITKVARQLGTFEVSKVPCADSCTVFMPEAPATNAKVGRLRADEQYIAEAIEADLLDLALSAVRQINLQTLEEGPWEAGQRK